MERCVVNRGDVHGGLSTVRQHPVKSFLLGDSHTPKVGPSNGDIV